MRILIEGGRIIDPANGIDGLLDVLIEDGRIAWIGTGGQEPGARTPGKARKTRDASTQVREGRRRAPEGGPHGVDWVLDARGKVVCPGFVDLHVHLREPGREDEETVATGTRAAARGGFTSICSMPNTDPVNDNQSVTEFILDQAKREGVVNVFPVGAITKGLKGEELAEIGELVQSGCVAITDDGMPVMNAEVMRRALEYSTMFRIPVIQHAEDLDLTGRGVMHEGVVSMELGFQGIPSAAEAVMVARDILLAELTGGHYHVAHISAAETVRLVREAKARGLRLTAEVSPHHLSLTDETVRSFSTQTKMKPPLRSDADREALWEGLKDGTIDAIATDHAPHAQHEKEQEYDHAPFGILGLETALGVTITTLVEPGILTLAEAIAKLTWHPARAFNLPKGTLAVGADADVTIFDPIKEWEVDVRKFASKSRNSPYHGWKLKGEVVATLVAGKVVWEQQG